MSNWTKEQQEAINKEGSNIIVSAGAGSGKTAVLTERVIRKLKSGTNINEILILTFTNAASYEMKERIRDAIAEDSSLKKQLDLIDGSYITTFDSFSLSIVKKYHYLLNIPRDVSIIDNSIIYNEKVKLLNAIMEEHYHLKDADFLKLISDFCIKDDKDIFDYIIKINDKMDLLMDKEEFLNSYIDKYYDIDFINKNIDEYIEEVKKKFFAVKESCSDLLALAENNFYDDVLTLKNKYDNALSYEDIYNVCKEGIPRLPRGCSTELKEAKEDLSNALSELNKYINLSTVDEIREKILSTKPYARIIVSIIKELNAKLKDFKFSNNTFEFNDIAHMAINVVKENIDVRNTLKNSFKEIMIDEYQDTSYLQESFINLIASNNVYMVGDIKQSIYRFRNADPYIFKEKYDHYSKNDGGIKIDLLKNFRSRGEVLNNINLIFDAIMDDAIGGAEYQESHRMVFGNNSYIEEGKTNQNYDMEVLRYNLEKGYEYSKNEVEIFTIVKDIKEKVESNYQVFDKKKKILRPIKYSDFCILLDRSTNFDLYKKVFEYFNVPLTKYTTTNIKKDDDILIIKNILSLLICLQEKDFGMEFKYNFLSIGRSYLFRYDDEELFDYLDQNAYVNSSLYHTLLDIEEKVPYLSLSKIIELIIDKFSFYSKGITIGDIEKISVRLEYILNLSKQVEKMGFNILEFRDYLVNIIDSDEKMECEISDNIMDSVKIMTIHKSKGLEYHICYFAGFDKEFNLRELNDRFIFSQQYGIICPFFDLGIGDTFYKVMYRDSYIKDEISEKIRLFYVALTRCKEKMILVCNFNEEEASFDNIVSKNIRMNYRSFKDIMDSIISILHPYIKDIDLNTLNLTHDYKLIKKSNYQDKIKKSEEKIKDISIDIPNEEKINKHYSKTSDSLFDFATKEKMEFGTYMHYLFEVFDFKKKDFEQIDEEYRPYLEKFLNCGIDFSGNIFKEYEFVYEEDNVMNYGVIDLMIEYEKSISIIDYKLKNIADENYLKQLEGYRSYIKKKTNKDVSIYLYSIMDGVLKELD